MTDYLEEWMEGSVQALLEEQRRLERQLRSGGLWRRDREQDEPDWADMPDQEAERLRSLPKGMALPDAEAGFAPMGTNVGAAEQSVEGTVREDGTARLAGSDEGREWQTLPLLEQIVRLERPVWNNQNQPNRRAPDAGLEPMAGTRRGFPEGGADERTGDPSSLFASGRNLPEQNWIQQVDRVFQRDSRRYDGGFFLY